MLQSYICARSVVPVNINPDTLNPALIGVDRDAMLFKLQRAAETLPAR
jgi:hypothetical protein